MFNKADYTEVGEYVIDVLLDASGSQGGRVTPIAMQGRILADAFCDAGIPCQISMFYTDMELLT